MAAAVRNDDKKSRGFLLEAGEGFSLRAGAGSNRMRGEALCRSDWRRRRQP
ncbi:hypothetical protein GL279_15090 [Paracoccus limosus]|jgi:hypothetical protein|uniref:Uncharacterized protein n=1 Tax=Paracoccus limosus TaxID=913252 RepID=A0A844H8N3_9RHOB|nr:hypothetical protein [Paracoccus limosus]